MKDVVLSISKPQFYDGKIHLGQLRNHFGLAHYFHATHQPCVPFLSGVAVLLINPINIDLLEGIGMHLSCCRRS